MALTNQSAAFLAGQQHGAKLAVQHSAPTASPKGKPAAQKPVPGSLQDLLAQAKALAAQDTAAQVGAYKAQQDTYTQQGQDRAQQINLASQAAAKLLQGFGLADNTGNSYNNAATTLAGIAGGYSGDLKNTAVDAASQVQAQLANLGAPAGSLKTSTGETANPQALGNVLYGLGGAIPGNLLVTSGQAAAAAQRGLPASTLAFGQQQAAGTLAAAQQQADQLDPQILAARAGNPAAIRQYLSSLLSAKNQAFDQKLALAKYKTGIDEFNASQSATAAYRQSQLDFKQQGLRLQEKQYKLDLQSKIAAGARPNAALSKIYGYVVDVSGNAVLDATGHKIKVRAADGTKPLTAERIGILTGDANALAADAFSGFTDPKTNKKYDPLNFGQALAHMRMGTGHGAIPLPIALKALKQAGFNVPAKYDKLMGGSGQQADPFASAKVVGAASSFLGVPYKWGGNDPQSGLDCSSFIQQAFAKVGISLPRTTYAQVKVGRPVTLNQLQPGDVIFTRPGKNGPEHVGLYIGGGQVQESPHTGDVNKVIPLSAYLSDGFVAARRYGN